MDISAELKPLSAQERAFVQSYLFGPEPGNGYRAALLAYDCKNEATARSMARRILDRPHVQAAISRVKQSEMIPLSQFWTELKKVIEQDKSYAAKIAGLRLKAEIDGLIVKSSKQSQLPMVDQSVMDDLAARIQEYQKQEEEYGRTQAQSS